MFLLAFGQVWRTRGEQGIDTFLKSAISVLSSGTEAATLAGQTRGVWAKDYPCNVKANRQIAGI